jgi:hypothetical protein
MLSACDSGRERVVEVSDGVNIERRRGVCHSWAMSSTSSGAGSGCDALYRCVKWFWDYELGLGMWRYGKTADLADIKFGVATC